MLVQQQEIVLSNSSDIDSSDIGLWFVLVTHQMWLTEEGLREKYYTSPTDSENKATA